MLRKAFRLIIWIFPSVVFVNILKLPSHNVSIKTIEYMLHSYFVDYLSDSW